MGKCKGTIVDCLSKWNCVDDLGLCYSVVSPQPKPDNKPIPDNNKKKTTPAPISKNVCKMDNGIEVDTTFFDPEMFQAEGFRQFKKFLIKYYPTYVDREGGVEKLNTATVNDCIIVRLFNTGDTERKQHAIGNLIYSDWKKFVGGYQNSDSKSVEEFENWKKGDTITDEDDKVNHTQKDWQDLIDKGQLNNKGKLISWEGVIVMLYKYNPENTKRVKFSDDLTSEGKIDRVKIIDNINSNANYYAYLKYPIKNNNSINNIEHPLKSKKYKFVVKYDANKDPYLSSEYVSEVGVIGPKTTIDESLFKKFILEKIREKNQPSNNLYEVTTMTSTQDPDEEDGDIELTDKKSTNSENQETDVFGLNNPKNNLGTTEAKKNFINSKTPTIQTLINRGARSNDFLAWNTLAASLGATKLTYNDKDKDKVDKVITIDKTNSFNVGEPEQKGQYTEQPFYNVLNITGNELNTGKIYTPISVTNKQPYIDVKVSIPFCRTQLINYLKDGLSQNYSGNPQQDWNRKYEICGCNQRGGYEPFKFYRKLPQFGKNQTGREKLDVRPNSSVFTQTADILNPETGEEEKFVGDIGGSASPFIPVLNKKMNWKEIKDILSGGKYKSRDGLTRTIDSELVIAGFDEGGDCVSDRFISTYPYKPTTETQKESFDERIDNKLLESIKDKNKKESIIENVLKNLLKDK